MDQQSAAVPNDGDTEVTKVTVQTELKLKQNIGLIRGASIVVGTVIGSGIFIFPGGTLRLAGSVGLALVIWGLGAVITFLNALTWSELGSVVRKSGSEYAFLRQCYGPLPAFLFVWTGITIGAPSSLAVASLTFSHYVLSQVEFCGPVPDLLIKLCAVLMLVYCVHLCAIGVASVYIPPDLLRCACAQSTAFATRVMVVCTFLKTAALCVIVVGGIVRMAQGYTSVLSTGFSGSTTSSSDIALAFYFINYSYGGWDNIYVVFEEVKNPKRNLLLSTGGGLLIVAVLYVLANVSFLTVMTTDQLLASPAVAVTWGDVMLRPVSILMPLAIIASVFGSASTAVFAGSSVMPEFFSFIHVRRYSPLPAVIFRITLAVAFLMMGDIGDIINFLTFPNSVFQVMSVASLFVFRRSRPDAARFFRVPLLVPALVIAYNTFLVVTPLVLDPRWEFLYAAVFITVGAILYVPFVKYQLKPKVFDTVETKLQLLLEVSPTTYQKED
ncbi:hypothetical protein BaRGS_00010618 [Batillaria attramentaria]|uniref:Amino acid transporter n=1 Tax=Batillaria attramentaria TaxID=370345 RepID=A0ABD0LF73_9CAEN